ncbi:fungal-specific transcription factor domain-containing protein [Aspergillus pseudoustus]|uniref:Fungal-specific transcription factor domain-containing protein n=1 Tax=Aspergillus pseudoustus TaxID=1810923 RepID=A0ABR4KC91_9EURO
MVISTPWLQFTGHQPKRKRAELACTICHSKKIRCDLQVRTGQGLNNCTNCDSAGKECRMRPSKRITRRTRGPLTPPESSGSGSTTRQTQAQPAQSQSVEEGAKETTDESIALRDPEWIWNFDNPNPLPETGHPNLNPPPVDLVGDNPSCSPATCRTDDTETRRDLSSRYYELEIQADARNQEQRLLTQRQPDVRLLPSPDLQQSFIETYLEYCSPWCPVLDRDQLNIDDLSQSPLLVNALAIVGSHIQPPVIPHDGPAAYYERARNLFYNDAEPDVVRSLQAVSLFYWWSPRPPSILHRHSSWWWTSCVVRHCQQLGVHQQPSLGPGPASSQHNHPANHRSHLIRRRIWWTAFARERLTSICQGKPSIIDEADCDITEPTLDDFPDALIDPTARIRAEIFIHWVRLCAIIGRIAKYLARPTPDTNTPFPTHLARELITWVQSLPPHLQLPINADRTTNFNRDVHQMHLPYLAVIIMLHLKQPYQPHHPEAYPPAILAASCVARIFRDTLARGGTRFLMAITGWYCGMAFIALLQACRVDGLAAAANEDLDILTLAVDQLRTMWPTAEIFHAGFQRLRPSAAGAEALLSLSNSEPNAQAGPAATVSGVEEPTGTGAGATTGASVVETSVASNPLEGINWMEYFPFATAQTSGVAERLLVPHTDEIFFEDFPETMVQFQDLFGDYTFSDMNLFT